MSKKQYELDAGRYILMDEELQIHFDEEFHFPSLPSLDECKDSSDFELRLDSSGQVSELYSLKQGLKHGFARHYHENGSIKWEACYKESLLHGPSKYFSDKGTLLSITWFYEGKEEGVSYQYTIHGSPFSKLCFRKGRLHKRQEYYYEDGSLKSILHYEDGALHGDVELFFEDGKPKRLCHFVHGKRQGTDTIHSREGIILDEGNYENGLPIGLHQRRYPSGKLREEILYYSPTKFERKEWNEKGELKGGEGHGSSL